MSVSTVTKCASIINLEDSWNTIARGLCYSRWLQQPHELKENAMRKYLVRDWQEGMHQDKRRKPSENRDRNQVYKARNLEKGNIHIFQARVLEVSSAWPISWFLDFLLPETWE